MPNIQTEIIDWLHTKQNWLQEAATRILDNEEITETDIDELTALLKTNAGQTVTTTHTFAGLGAVTTPNTLVLESIGDIKGIDSLAPRNPLVFGTYNLTVIYGNNGSGKSGYTRILKKATGKTNAVDLKHDVFSPLPADRSCKIKYQINGTSMETTWIANSAPVDDLRGIDIFDSDNAKLYLTKEKEATYTPPLISLFEELVSVCKRIGEKLDAEKRLLVSSLPTLDSRYTHTEVGRLYNSLTTAHTEESLVSILNFSAEDAANMKALSERLETEDSAAKAAKVRKEKDHIIKIIDQLKTVYNLVSTEACNALIALKKDAITKRGIATEAIKENDDLSELEGVGSHTWRALWEAARAYSITEAYKEADFPKVEDAKCVLCHQDLSTDAQKRMLNFETFVKSTLERDAKTAESSLQIMLEKLPTKPTDESLSASLELTGLDSEEWKSKLESLWREIEAKSDELKTCEINAELAGLEVSTVVTELEAISLAMEATALQFDEDAKAFDRAEATRELLELSAKQWTSAQNIAILNEVQRLNSIQEFDTWKTLTQQRGISRKASELSEQIITDEYVRRFNVELARLGANRIKVEILKTGVREGVVKHQLKLRDTITQAPVADILSEGEQRIISLAAFLADVTGRNESTPFVFDDPISSLDQDFEEKTIDRLIQLSEDRQVIVFTHRLSFLGIINDRAASLEQVHIRKEPWGSGEVGEIPLFGKRPERALTALKGERLAKANKTYLESGTEDYYPLAKAICSDFRILLERIVEFYFLADVVQRHRRAINTMGKIGNLVKITQEDCDLIDTYMTKYSVYEHSQSAELPAEMPEPEELETDITAILTWYDDFKAR
ncbi:MAG: AAA family ATPase [Sulfurovum sp.]|nr:AAA family ATPase [Sulfurovum sp.]